MPAWISQKQLCPWMLTYISPGHSFPVPLKPKEEQEEARKHFVAKESRDEQAGTMVRRAPVAELEETTDAVTRDICPTGRLFLSAIKLGQIVLIRT